MSEITLENYKSEWKEYFIKISNTLKTVLTQQDYISIEHVGSTSIEGLKAKPIIDIDIVVKDNEEDIQNVIEKLQRLGYHHLGDYGIPGREVMKKESYVIKHNLYVCAERCVSLLNHIYLRDYLRQNPKAAEEYGALKEKIVLENNEDRVRYGRLKTEFICNILEKQGMPKEEIKNIKIQNGLK